MKLQNTRSAAALGCALLMGSLMFSEAEAGWVAYNDSSFKEGQVNAPNVTTFGLGRNFQGEGLTGSLLHFPTGQATPVTVTFEETFSTGSINSAGDAATYGAGSDAEGLFGGKVDLSGNMSYGDSPGWHLDTIFTGLDPAKKYTFAGTVNRNGGASYAPRVTNWRVLGADGYTYASSAGAHRVAEDSVEFSTGNNPDGLVARWVDIQPGADGTITIRTSHSVGEANGGLPGASAYQGYAGGVFLMVEQEDNWEAYNDSSYKTSQVLTENVTTYGVGRNFQGEGPGGVLKVFQTGADSTVTVMYEEFFSTGSINSAGDAAEFAPGSDAEALFAGKVDFSGNMSYGDSPGWYLDLIISGLDPTRLYTFAGTAHRNGGASYAPRVTNWRILGADSHTYASSTGAHRVADDSVEFSTGNNPDGLVARWTNIRPGSDGKVVIRTSHSVGEANGGLPGASAFQGYAGGVFMVRAQSPGEFRWAAFNDSSFKNGQVNAGGVTTYGVGRNFAGEGSTGLLNDLLGGRPTPVTATFEETLSTGSINSAGDAAPFPVGSDAEAWFKGIADLSGNMSYGDSPGWRLDLTFTGLDPSKAYTFVGTAHRNGGASYSPRVTNWRIVGADTSFYASSSAAHRVSDDSVEFSTGNNDRGLVARWVNIRPGADGTFVIRTSHSVGEANGGLPGASAFQGYAGGVFMLAEQVGLGGGGSDGLTVTSLFPAEGALDVHPGAPIVVTIQHSTAVVDATSVELKLDNVVVATEVVAGEGVTFVRHQPATALASASVHTVALSFKSAGAEPVTYTRDWGFTVLDYSQVMGLPENVAVDFNPLVHRTRGFAIEVVGASPEEYPITDLDVAEQAFVAEIFNLADTSLFNELGYFIETQDINYQIDLATKGAKAGERRFPGIAGSGEPGNQFAFQAKTLLHLKPGYYRINVTMSRSFRLLVGPEGGEQELPAEFVPCTNCGGDDGPWLTEFVVTKEGIYPFRLLFYSGGGGSSLEWLEVTATGSRLLINENLPGSIPAYVPAFALPPETLLGITRTANGATVNWTGSGVLQSAPALTGPWTDVIGATSPYMVVPTADSLFYKVRQ